VAYRGVAAGFPKSLCEIYLLRAIRLGMVVLVVREEAARHSRAAATRLASSLLIPLERVSLVEIESWQSERVCAYA